MIFPNTEVRLTGCLIPGSSFQVFLEEGQSFPFSGHQGLHLPAMTFEIL